MSDLPSWTQSRLTAVYQAPDDETFHNAFDAAFSPKCEVFASQESSESIETLKEQLLARRAATVNSKVDWDNTPTLESNEAVAGPAAIDGSFVVTRSLKFRIRAGPAQRLTHVVFEAKVDQGEGDTDDSRRIVSFRHTSTDSTPPIHFQTPHE
ncbi:hypothetical protein BJ138DRAFT_1109026 [Hygrophoropsis aurantiaca]|uniref:Uncharacterized protein n=1 Tax=Hygrophoropsis aurantiaca TaxID=72124 RepID=A0ACB8ASB2_9AGAM|nr:hypothetical protein BJ138DRAFT_1109026 [Hygrophoropsis aurantiaca]